MSSESQSSASQSGSGSPSKSVSKSSSSSSSSSSERELAKPHSKSSSESSKSSESPKKSDERSQEEEKETLKQNDDKRKSKSVKDEDATVLLSAISTKLKTDADRKIREVSSKTDLANEIQSPRTTPMTATGESEIHPELFKACFEGDLATVKSELEQDPKLAKVVDPAHGTSLLHHASSGGSVDVVKYLLEKGAVLDHVDNEGVGALHYAAIHGQADVIKELLKKKSKLLNMPCGKLAASPAGTPLYQSAYFNHLKAFKELLKGGTDITIKDVEKRTILHLIIFKNRIMMFDELIATDDVKKIVDEVDLKGDSAFHYAIARKNASMVDALIKVGANVNIVDAEGVTPLILATQNNMFATVKALIAKSAKVQLKDKKGKQALDYASELGHNDILYYLVNSGGDPTVLYNGKSKQGQSKPPDEPTDKYGFFINQPLYKKLIVIPNELGEDTSDKIKSKYSKMLSKPLPKLMKDKATMKTLKKAIVNGTIPIASRKELWKKVLLHEDDDKTKAKKDKKNKKKAASEGAEEKSKREEHPKLDDYLKKDLDMKAIVQIDKDIERCMRIHKDLNVRYGPGQCRLFRLLRAYAAFDKDTVYTQGMSTIGAIILMHFDDDAEAWQAMVNLFSKWKLHDWYMNDLAGLREEVFVTFTGMMQKHLKKTKLQLDSLHIAPSLFITPWCLELFFSNLPYELVIRFWDLFILMGPLTLYRLCMAIMKLNEDNVWAAVDVEGIYSALKGNPIRDTPIEKVLKMALNKKFKWSDKKVAKFLEQGKLLMKDPADDS